LTLGATEARLPAERLDTVLPIMLEEANRIRSAAGSSRAVLEGRSRCALVCELQESTEARISDVRQEWCGLLNHHMSPTPPCRTVSTLEDGTLAIKDGTFPWPALRISPLDSRTKCYRHSWYMYAIGQNTEAG
jgi:hypothetical protein